MTTLNNVSLGQNPVLEWFKELGREIGGEIIGDKELKTQAIVLATQSLIGSQPIVDRRNPAVNVIRFTKAQRARLESFFDKKITTDKGTGKPANVKIDHQSLWMPFAIRKALPYAVGIGVLGFVAGRMLK